MMMVLHLDLLSKHFHSTPFQSQHATLECQYHLAPEPIRPWSNKPRETKITQIPTLAASWVDRCYPEGSVAKASSEMPYLDLCTTGGMKLVSKSRSVFPKGANINYSPLFLCTQGFSPSAFWHLPVWCTLYWADIELQIPSYFSIHSILQLKL